MPGIPAFTDNTLFVSARYVLICMPRSLSGFPNQAQAHHYGVGSERPAAQLRPSDIHIPCIHVEPAREWPPHRLRKRPQRPSPSARNSTHAVSASHVLRRPLREPLALARGQRQLVRHRHQAMHDNPLAEHQEGINAARTANGDTSSKLLVRHYRDGTRERATASHPKYVFPVWITCWNTLASLLAYLCW